MKRWIALLLAGLLLASIATAALAGPLHIGGGPKSSVTSSPLHIGGGPNAT
ncbi:MAG: hypothetical protein WBC63_00355 [Candidatus Bipolaricaulia bacterium]